MSREIPILCKYLGYRNRRCLYSQVSIPGYWPYSDRIQQFAVSQFRTVPRSTVSGTSAFWLKKHPSPQTITEMEKEIENNIAS